jgi:hypothetical protein
MSTPPPNYPPPGQGYGGPPPQQNSGGGGCLKAAGITCGVLILLCVIGGILFANWWKGQMHNPNSVLGQTFNQTMKVTQAGMDGTAIHTAVVDYKNKTGAYPANLEALVPNYIDGKKLHSDIDPNTSPGHISWKYIRPGATSNGKSPMLILPYQMSFTMNNQTKTVPGQIVINIDGTTNATSGPSGGYEQTPSSGS